MLKARYLWMLVSCLMALSLVMLSCGPAESAVEENRESPGIVVKKETKVVEKEVGEATEEVVEEAPSLDEVPYWKKDAEPIYGGTFTYADPTAPISFEPYTGSATPIFPAYEGAAFENYMTTPPEQWAFMTRFTPPEYFSGALAESWELSDDLKTMTMHVRKGVYWQDKPPVNGREFTAYDLEFNWNRIFGLTSEYEKTAYVSTFLYGKLETITATDKYTLEIKWSAPSMAASVMFLDVNTKIVAPEVVREYGDANDWKTVVSIGPFILDDYVPDSALTFKRNPNYWANDEHWPENQLPYVDELRVLIMPDPSTRYSAMRTGRLDLVRAVKWEDAASLQQTNPELVAQQFIASAFTIVMPPDRGPWGDIRVRKAMQMSIDLETIAETIYGGLVSSTPVGAITPAHKGFSAPYEDWPQDVKDAHVYNPEGAKKLLAEAGYPDGFKARLTMSVTHDTDLAQVLVGYFADIGVDVELDLMEYGSWRSYVRGGKTDLAYPIWTDSATIPPQYHFPHWGPNYYEHPMRGVDDPIINDLVDRTRAATTFPDMAALIQETDMHVISQFYNVRVLPTVSYQLFQPWVKRIGVGDSQRLSQAIARLWIDPEVKKSLGR